jgi:hypothetical protein
VPVSSVFHRMLSPAQLERAALATLREWMPEYLAEMERQLNYPPGTLPIPTNYSNRNSFDAQAGEVTPKVIAISPGLQGEPMMLAGTQYRAVWQLGIGVTMDHTDEEIANDWCKAYGTTVRKLLSDKQSLGGFPGVAQVAWIGETYEDLPFGNATQLYKAAGVYFLVDVENVITARTGPKTHGDVVYGQVEEVDIDIIKVPVTDELPES